MSKCKKFKDLIEQYLDGTISDSQFTELEEHTKTCESCREEFEQSVLLQKTIKHAFSSTISSEEARASVITKLPEKENHQIRNAGYRSTWLGGKRAAVAAGILLAVGLLSGFVLGRKNIAESTRVQLAAKVPMQLADLEGTVLVKHKGSDTWQTLTPDSSVHIGDTFHSAAKSFFVLKLENDSTIEVDQNSMLALTFYNGQTQFILEHGKCKAALKSPHGRFFISTPHGRVEALGTEFTVTVE
ncbi:MAG TPA: FecR domain-containing protein [Sedimentisphaerales bacterium]|nr:FecR domain-containing protein [Sedimentisphaerales bacterium]